MTELFENVGVYLFGGDWKSPLAAALGVNRRTVLRWVDGTSPIPAGVWGDMHKMVCAKKMAGIKIEHALRQMR